jgi:hypothetical protein
MKKQSGNHPRPRNPIRKRPVVFKNSKAVCLKCRKKGHFMKDCAETAPISNPSHSATCCFRCGSTSHSLKHCDKPNDNGELPFAVCFVCNGKGHLASACSKNERGIYPMGGGCRFCGSNQHLQRNCPEKTTARLSRKKTTNTEESENLELGTELDDGLLTPELDLPRSKNAGRPNVLRSKKTVSF